jgi:H+/Cl- antiporter ClcA
MRKKLRASDRAILIPATILTAVCVSLVYFYFEAAVRNSTNFIWQSLLNTETRRLLVVPASILLSLIFFGVQRFYDKKNEQAEVEGLGGVPVPTAKNFIKVIGLGFLSLIAGASLGPEAILLPASLIIGGYLAEKVFKKDIFASALSSAGFIAIIAAFFNSFWAGLLGLLLLKRQQKLKLDAFALFIASIASLVTVLVLSQLSSRPYAKLPASHWHVSLSSSLIILALLVCGFATTHLFHLLHKLLNGLNKKSWERGWLFHGLLTGAGISALYLLGGPLIEFTGNESIVPMLHKATSLGILGLLWLACLLLWRSN